jgi:hypothetical protein
VQRGITNVIPGVLKVHPCHHVLDVAAAVWAVALVPSYPRVTVRARPTMAVQRTSSSATLSLSMVRRKGTEGKPDVVSTWMVVSTLLHPLVSAAEAAMLE